MPVGWWERKLAEEAARQLSREQNERATRYRERHGVWH